MLLLTVGPEQYHQLTLSLPNGINAILEFGCALFAMLFCIDRRRWHFIVSVLCLAIGLNFKTDIIVVTPILALALGIGVFQRGLAYGLRTALLAGTIGAAAFLLTMPGFLADPLQDMRVRFHIMLTQSSAGYASDYLWTNLQTALKFVISGLLWDGAPPVLLVVVAIVVVGACMVLARSDNKAGAAAVAGGFLIAIGIWLVMLLRVYSLADRYLLHGLAQFLAATAVALALLARDRGRAGYVVPFVLLGIFALYTGRAGAESIKSAATYQRIAAFDGLDPVHARNRASRAAIDILRAGSYASEVLVDQHAYIDLRAFRERGYDPHYVNLTTLDDVIAKLPAGKKYVVVFGNGDADRHVPHRISWEGDWSDAMKAAYARYLSWLRALPQLHHVAGAPIVIMAIDPVARDADLSVSVFEKP